MASLAACGAALAGCSSDGNGSAAAKVSVTGTDTACEMSRTALGSGKVDFEFTNKAGKVNELYVVTSDDETKGEVENVTSGTTRSLSVDLDPGDYLVRCKPGQSGKGFTQEFKVNGSATAKAAPTKTVRFDAVDFSYKDLDLTGIAAGSVVRFEMGNSGSEPHEFEVLGPDGKAVGEIAEVEPGGKGAATIRFTQAGDYAYKCQVVDPGSHEHHDRLGMKGTFTVEA